MLLTYSALVHPGNTAHRKICGPIDLRVVDKQLAGAQVAERLSHSTMLPLYRLGFRPTRKPTIRDARMTEQLERKQRLERERRAKHKHVEQLRAICSHGRDVIAVNHVAQDKSLCLSDPFLLWFFPILLPSSNCPQKRTFNMTVSLL
jgi:ATP-dependent helicase STH1/SNF2